MEIFLIVFLLNHSLQSKIMKIIAIILLFILFISCSDEHLKKQFHGKWQSISGNSELFVDDELKISHTDSDGKREILGIAEIKAGEISLRNEKKMCPGIKGHYFYEIYRDTLQFRVKDDRCNLRVEMIDKKKFLKE